MKKWKWLTTTLVSTSTLSLALVSCSSTQEENKVFNNFDKRIQFLQHRNVWSIFIDNLSKTLKDIFGITKTTYLDKVKKMSQYKGLLNDLGTILNETQKENNDIINWEEILKKSPFKDFSDTDELEKSNANALHIAFNKLFIKSKMSNGQYGSYEISRSPSEFWNFKSNDLGYHLFQNIWDYFIYLHQEVSEEKTPNNPSRTPIIPNAEYPNNTYNNNYQSRSEIEEVFNTKNIFEFSKLSQKLSNNKEFNNILQFWIHTPSEDWSNSATERFHNLYFSYHLIKYYSQYHPDFITLPSDNNSGTFTSMNFNIYTKLLFNF
ncbi:MULTISPECIES: hypothetical protein [unclassified Mycoplasma]|uniref:hypothetical protein n=1 Tax=unclassified Mycoplasma TaxID=2683645 RepID=UPI00211C4F09|nr:MULTISPECIES: hypothetical protein [unclassified Mycoplasma]UUM19605.1 hypothetical protein NPA11_02405 [Mycoplasma sp. 1578d]UUM24575.1 hypothetical protein NPA12_02635 [Mycoplasma sp. 3686d]